MLEHLKILSIIVIMIIGVIAIIYVSLTNRSHPERYLVYLIRYTLVSTAGVTILFLFFYFSKNMPDGFIFSDESRYSILTDCIYSLLGIGVIYYMTAILLAFRNKRIKKEYRRLIISLVIFFCTFYILRFSGIENETLNNIIGFIRSYIFENIIILEIVILVGFLIFWDKKAVPEQKRISNYFALIYLARYLLAFSVLLFFLIAKIPDNLKLLIGFFILAYFHLAPVIWLRYVYIPYATRMKNLISEGADLQIIYTRYHITKREAEIIELILDGMNNKEIQDKLFISFHTVKNHVSNIYRKLNVKSRHEMVAFFVKRMKPGN